MALVVDGWELPPLLETLMAEGRWNLPADALRIAEVTGNPDPVDARSYGPLDPPGMTRTLTSYLLADDQFLRNLGIRRASTPGQPVELPLLDLSKCVILWISVYENLVCLDYRPPDGPRVVGSACGFPQDSWRVLADSFEDFARRVGLIEAP